MVKLRLFDRFRRDNEGVVLAEALLSLPIVILFITAMAELGLALFQWNQTVRAVQLGARLAAVSGPVTTDYDTAMQAGYDNGTANTADDYVVGDPVPPGIVRSVCDGGTGANCETADLARLVYGPDGACLSTATGTAAGMCDVAPWIRPENLRVTYTRAGLGYVGRPWGNVSTVTVEVRNLSFDFILLDAFINNDGITIPAHPVTITSEDLWSCSTYGETC